MHNSEISDFIQVHHTQWQLAPDKHRSQKEVSEEIIGWQTQQ